MPSVDVQRIRPEQAHDLRRRILRDGRAEAIVVQDNDDDPRSAHYGAFVDGRLTGVLSFDPDVPTPHRPGRRAGQFRAVAVDGDGQRRGVGRALMAEVVAEARRLGMEVLWAKGRDSAWPFYERLGFQVVGEPFRTRATGLPHHIIVLDLDTAAH
ncbi:MAG: GNAT family N-acetyltransferase [Candidatus Dormibacteria bacterium]